MQEIGIESIEKIYKYISLRRDHSGRTLQTSNVPESFANMDVIFFILNLFDVRMAHLSVLSVTA